MKQLVRILVAFLLVALFLPLTGSSVEARKQVFKASLKSTNELHEVVGSTARGSAVLAFNQDGSMRISVFVRGLSGDVVNGAHIHGPATESENAPVLIPLCGNPTPNVAGACTVVNGELTFTGDITSAFLATRGILPSTFVEYLEDGLLYVNVHTPSNPSGETRGQLYPVD